MVYIPHCKGLQFLVVAHFDLSGWIEAKPLHTLSSKIIVDFFWKDVICQHEYFRKLVINGNSENKELVAELTQIYKIKKVQILAYYL